MTISSPTRGGTSASGTSASAAPEGTRLERGQLRRLEATSVVEASTLLLLLGVAVPLKHFAGWKTGVTVLGPVHGLAFLAYLWTATETVAGGGWSRRDMIRLFVVAAIPGGGFANLAFLQRRVARLTDAADGVA